MCAQSGGEKQSEDGKLGYCPRTDQETIRVQTQALGIPVLVIHIPHGIIVDPDTPIEVILEDKRLSSPLSVCAIQTISALADELSVSYEEARVSFQTWKAQIPSVPQARRKYSFSVN